jgi:hypothetical protein
LQEYRIGLSILGVEKFGGLNDRLFEAVITYYLLEYNIGHGELRLGRI